MGLKHVGIVYYIGRFGRVNPSIANLSVYHNWPGFFALNALITRVAGLDSALSYASWAPLFFNLCYLAGVAMIVRTLTNDHRTIALSAWIFALANWVRQDYFAPAGTELPLVPRRPGHPAAMVHDSRPW